MRTGALKTYLRTALGPALPYVRRVRLLPERWRANRAVARLQAVNDTSVCYLTRAFPKPPPLRSEMDRGGQVKLSLMAGSFPHSYPRAGILYTVSSVDHAAKTEILRGAKERGLKIVLNQNGVAYPAWHGQGWELINQKLREAYELADFIVYQSEFCRASAINYLGNPKVEWNILFNPVDLTLFSPAEKPSERAGPVLLLGGSQFDRYRFEVAAQVLKHVLPDLPKARLIVTGNLWGQNPVEAMAWAKTYLGQLGVEQKVEFTGPYSQQTASSIFRNADVLIHTQFNDASPSVVCEALASGLPVIYSASGGTPELVGPEAGIGIPVKQSWEQIDTPDPTRMAEGVAKVWGRYTHYAVAARQRALAHFSLEKYVQAHSRIFADVLK